MKQINTKQWKEFVITDFFAPQIVSNKLSKLDIDDDGFIPVQSSESINNGILGYTSKKADFTCENNEFYLIFGDHTKSMNIADYSFCVMDNVKVLKTKIHNKNIALFIITVWKKAIPDLGYARHWGIAKEKKFKLPIDETGNPDFSYMESYMKNLEIAVSSSLTDLQSAKEFSACNQIYTKQWKEFIIKDLFTVTRPSARSQIAYDSGDVPFIASGNFNNGVLKYLKPKEDEILEAGNCITVSPIDGSSFYQECDFLGRGGAGSSIILLYNPNLNLYSGYFIATVIRTVCKKYAYSDMANKDTIGSEKIKLPVNSKGEPDYLYMEEYMNNIFQKTRYAFSKIAKCI